jgi:hypothetical protein
LSRRDKIEARQCQGGDQASDGWASHVSLPVTLICLRSV